jgi:hypothetical protein
LPSPYSLADRATFARLSVVRKSRRPPFATNDAFSKKRASREKTGAGFYIQSHLLIASPTRSHALISTAGLTREKFSAPHGQARRQSFVGKKGRFSGEFGGSTAFRAISGP